MEPINIDYFRYKSIFSNSDKKYGGNVAIHFIISDIIEIIFRNITPEVGYESRYFSHVAGLFIDDEYWVFSIDMDLLNMDNIEIIAMRNTNRARIHLKGDKWFDNIDELKGNNLLTATVVTNVVKNLGPYIKSLYTNRNKQQNIVMAEKFASDFDIED